MTEKLIILSFLTWPKIIGVFFFIMLFVWLGVPEINKWRADKMVDELCAKDGGIKVYEAVKLPVERFSEFGEIYVQLKKDAKPTDEYYYTSETLWIVPKATQFGNLDLRRYHDKLFRAKNHKLLAEGVGYSRRGGDAAGPWHPSHYGCAMQSSIKYVNQKLFIRD